MHMASAITDFRALVEELAHPEDDRQWKAYSALIAAGDAPVPAVFEGLSHPNWRVRRGCALYADHNPDSALLERLKLTLNDPKAKVRLFAVHALSCEPCKPGGNPVDAIPLIIRALKEDKALRVRRHAANMLCQQPPERRIERALRWSLAHETDERMLRTLQRGLRTYDAQRAR
jgi:HEAT repeat protein